MTHVRTGDIFTRRVCLQLDGMDAVVVLRNIAYGPTDRGLRMDAYYPRDEGNDGRWPAVIIVAGYPGTTGQHPTTPAYKEIGWTVSMCRLIAASGMVAIAYTNREPVADFEALFEHIHECAGSLRIDPTRVGLIAVSGNVPTALTSVMQHARRRPTCAVFGYGCLLDLDGATDVADAARQFGFANPCVGRTFADIRRDVPLLIMRAGRDQFPAMNASIDPFIRQGLIENLPISFVNHAAGPHAFDLFDDSRASRDILRQTLRFLRQHLTAESSAARDQIDD
jgi:dienelactone hydrolase